MALMKAYLLAGSNMGERAENLNRAKEMLAAAGTVLRASSVYETAAWGMENQPPFLNQALLLETRLSPEKLLSELKQIERAIGRKQAQKWGPRLIDIDILLIDDKLSASAQLTVPHPQLHKRRFALVPLAEIAPQVLHPELKLTVQEMLDACADELAVKKTNQFVKTVS